MQFQIEYHCHVCKQEVFNPKKYTVHPRCKSTTSLDEVIVCLKYNKLVEDIIKAVKYNLYYDVANLMVELILMNLDINKVKNSVLLPVPLHRSKEWKRGFNQAELIAKTLSMHLSRVSISTDVVNAIKRIRNTKTQVGMSKEKRQQNLNDAFQLDKSKTLFLRDKKIILIDDVMTTGTTLEKCAETLRTSGFNNIAALVFARG